MASIYAFLFICLLLMGWMGQDKEPLIWEGIGPMFFILFPLNYFLLTASFSAITLTTAIILGGLFYFFLGKAIEKFVFLDIQTPSKRSDGR